MKLAKILIVGLGIALLSACSSTVKSSADASPMDAGASWALLPMANNTETPQAALAAEAIAEHLLRRRGLVSIKVYPASLTRDSLFDPSERKVTDEAQTWAKAQGVRYGLSGSVQEWKYKAGIDGEPVVALTLKVTDLASGKVVWSTTGAQTGWSRDSLSGVAQNLLADMLGTLPATAVAGKP